MGARRSNAVLDPTHVKNLHGGGLLDPVVVLDGRVIGTCWRTLRRRGVALELHLFEPGLHRHPAIATAAAKYGAFLGLEVVA